MKKETAVDWLIENLLKNNCIGVSQAYVSEYRKMVAKAKEMERQNIIDAWCNGNDSEPKEVTSDFAEQYYTQTFKD